VVAGVLILVTAVAVISGLTSLMTWQPYRRRPGTGLPPEDDYELTDYDAEVFRGIRAAYEAGSTAREPRRKRP
jgi:hypothetical protein